MPDRGAAAVIWDVSIRKRLQHGESRFDLDVAFASDARRVVLYGPSGAGKTQLLRMVAGISRPDSGHIVLDGQPLYDARSRISVPVQRRGLGYVFQDYALFPHLSVRQNIAFHRRRGWLNPPARFSDAVTDRWIAAFNLQAVAGHYPHQISGGQRQRTALARALAAEPIALLLDEPFAAMDKSLRSRLRDELSAVQQQTRLPMLLITHDDTDVEALADDVVTVAEGRVVGHDRTPAQR